MGELVDIRQLLMARANPTEDAQEVFAKTHKIMKQSRRTIEMQLEKIGTIDFGSLTEDEQQKYVNDVKDLLRLWIIFLRAVDNVVFYETTKQNDRSQIERAMRNAHNLFLDLRD